MDLDSKVIYGQPEVTSLVYSHMIHLREYIKIEKDKRPTRNYNDDIRLLLAEINFITRYVKYEERPVRIIYIGAAPGFHLAKLMKMFKFNEDECIYFDLYDDQPLHPDLEQYIIENPDQVTMYRELFSVDTAERYDNSTDDIYLITDQRDPKFSKDPIFGSDKDAKEKWQVEKEASYAADMELQKNICIRLQPKYACLRFRPPHFYTGITPDDEAMIYFSGVCWLMLYGDLKSTESRLVTSNYSTVDYKWNIKTYQYRLNYYNAEIRESLLLNPITKEQTPLPNMLGNMFEPVMTLVHIIEYFKSIGITSIRLKSLMDVYTKLIMVDYCSDTPGLFQGCSFKDVNSAGDGSIDQSCVYVDPSLELIN